MNKKLLPCPFCGGEAEVQNPYPKIFMVWCKDCRIGTTNCQSIKQAISKWNTRKPMESIVEQLEELSLSFELNCDKMIRENKCHESEDCGICAFKQAIEIVKGGVDNAE